MIKHELKKYLFYFTNKKGYNTLTSRNNTLFFLSVTFLYSLLLSSCQNDKDSFSLDTVNISLGIINQDSQDKPYTILLDNGDTLVPIANAMPFFKTRNEQRVMVNYTPLSESECYHTFYVKINSLYDILLKNIVEISSKNNDSIGSDPVIINDIWKSNNFLNIEFSFLGGDYIHSVNLVHTVDNINNEVHPIHLEFRHNAKNDQHNLLIHSIVSFDLKSIRIKNQDSVSFNVNSIDYQNNTHTFSSVYYYN